MSINLHVNIEKTPNGTAALVSTSDPDTTAAVTLSVNDALDRMGVSYSSVIFDGGQGFSVGYKTECSFEVFHHLLSQPDELIPSVQKLYWGSSERAISIGLEFELEAEAFIDHILEHEPW